MSEHPFHHGNLRTALLDAAERTLRDHGLDELSLRALAREAGVSHSAPRRHFADRRALLDGLAERGFTRLNDALGDSPDVTAAARAFVDFAVREPALLDLMFTTKGDQASPATQAAAARFFATVAATLPAGPPAAPGYPPLRQLLLAATLQGVAAMAASGRVPADLADRLVVEAADLLTAPGPRPAAARGA